MDSEKLNRWLTLGANFGVLVGIIFLAIEIRQNTESQEEARRLAAANTFDSRALGVSSIIASTFVSQSSIQLVSNEGILFF